jgi:hypothetical protein
MLVPVTLAMVVPAMPDMAITGAMTRPATGTVIAAMASIATTVSIATPVIHAAIGIAGVIIVIIAVIAGAVIAGSDIGRTVITATVIAGAIIIIGATCNAQGKPRQQQNCGLPHLQNSMHITPLH